MGRQETQLSRSTVSVTDQFPFPINTIFKSNKFLQYDNLNLPVLKVRDAITSYNAAPYFLHVFRVFQILLLGALVRLGRVRIFGLDILNRGSGEFEV
jgi:hypothetical protein